MIQQNTLLVMLVRLVERIPTPPLPAKRGKRRPSFYPDTLFLKALVIMIIKHLHSPYELLCGLEQPTPEMAALRSLLTEDGRYPTRRTWERRLAALPNKLPAQIGCLGRHLVELIQPWSNCGRAVAADSTVLRARGGVWHKKHRLRGEVPHTLIDTQAHWTKSGYHGWVYGYEAQPWALHLITVVGGVWIPLAAQLTPANHDDSAEAEKLVGELPADVRVVLGDQHYNTPTLGALCTLRGWLLVATHRGKPPKTDTGKEVRCMFHKLRSVAISLWRTSTSISRASLVGMVKCRPKGW